MIWGSRGSISLGIFAYCFQCDPETLVILTFATESALKSIFKQVKNVHFYIVDVFAEKKYTGNQLAVFTDVEGISAALMQQIAQEINYSETTFITSSQPSFGGYEVRIFTPKEEIPFGGHPTLGTAYIIQHAMIKQSVEVVNLNLQVGQIPVRIHYQNDLVELLWMRQNLPTFGQSFPAAVIAPLLNLEAEEIDPRFPIQEVSTGLPFFIVPLKTQASLKKAQVNKHQYFEFIQNTQAKAILIFCPETYKVENDLSVRVFVDYFGIPEDPATGSANGCLAAYLVNYSYFGKPEIDIKVEQGYEINRPSLLLLKAVKNNEQITVDVGGKVILVAKGEFLATDLETDVTDVFTAVTQ